MATTRNRTLSSIRLRTPDEGTSATGPSNATLKQAPNGQMPGIGSKYSNPVLKLDPLSRNPGPIQWVTAVLEVSEDPCDGVTEGRLVMWRFPKLAQSSNGNEHSKGLRYDFLLMPILCRNWPCHQ